MRVTILIGAIGLAFAMSAANAKNGDFESEIISPTTLSSNAGEHNDRRNCQLAQRRGQDLPRYCSLY